MINAKETLVGTLNTAIEYIPPVTQEKEVTPKEEIQEVTPDTGYTGLSKVTVDPIPNEYVIPNGIVDINSNGVSNVSGYASANVNVKPTLQSKKVTPSKETQNITFDEDYEGLSNVVVEPISEEYIKPTGTIDITTSGIHNVKEYESANVNVGGIEITDASYLFYYGTRQDIVDELCALISKNCNACRYMFYQCTLLTTIPQFDTSGVTNFEYMFQTCSKLTEIPQLNTSNGTNFNSMFYNCTSLTTIPELDTSNGTLLSAMFRGCSKLTEIPQLNTSNATSLQQLCRGCTNLISVPLLDCGFTNQITNVLADAKNVTTLGGFKDLGKAYITTTSASHSNYNLDLSDCILLTHDSLMNVINNLYDIASLGVKPQDLSLGTTNLAKLSEEEQLIAMVKGWNLI